MYGKKGTFKYGLSSSFRIGEQDARSFESGIVSDMGYRRSIYKKDSWVLFIGWDRFLSSEREGDRSISVLLGLEKRCAKYGYCLQ